MALLIAAVWTPRLLRSLWVDEAGTFWMAHEGLVRAVQKTLHWPGQSVLYSAIISLFCFDGTPFRDAVMRVPSVVGIAAAGYFLYRIAEARIGHGTGLVAVTLFVFHPGVIAVGYQARPYALAMAAAIASCWALMAWEESRSRIYLACYIAASVLVIYLHYFFAMILAVHALYLAFVFLVEGRRRQWGEAIVAGTAILALSTPLIPLLRRLIDERYTLPYAPPPSFRAFTDSLAPSLLVAGLMLVGILLSFVQTTIPRDIVPVRPSFGVLVFAWWLLGPLVFFVVSRTTAMLIFMPRYLAFTLAAQSLLFAALGFRLFGVSGARVGALLGVAVIAANPLLVGRGGDGKEVLLPVIQMVRSDANAPVFFPSLLQESLSYDWRAGNRPDSYLFAPLVAYPISNPFYPVPIRPTDDARSYVDEIVDTRLAGVPEVLFVDKDTLWEAWIVERMHRAGMREDVRTSGHFKVFRFRR